MLSRLPWTPKPEPKVKPKLRRINKDRRRHLVETVATFLKTGEASKFEFEAPCRHALRKAFILGGGWGWAEADILANEIVQAALRQIGAQRPSWAEGQPDWAQNGSGAQIARTLCIRCGTRLPEGHTKFCSDLCAGAHHMAVSRINDPDRVNGVWNSWQARWSAKQPERICEGCGGSYKPRRPKQKYCRPECVYLRCDEVRHARAQA